VKAALSQPREKIAEHSLTHLLPPAPADPALAGARLPQIVFRTLNGFQHWDATLPPGEEETEALRVRRAYEVREPSGVTQRCVVELACSIRELVRTETGRDYPPADPLWYTVCRLVLSDYLWQRGEMPPEVISAYELSRKQIEIVRSVAGLGPRIRR
jgi:hypothetical protein